MDILFLLVPLSVVLVFLIMGVFAWALQDGQFDDLEREGARIFEDVASNTTRAAVSSPLDTDQGATRA